MKETDASNVVSFVLARFLPRRCKQFLRLLHTFFSPIITKFLDFLDGFLWLNYNPRYQIKKFLYDRRRNRILKRHDIHLINCKKISSAVPDTLNSDIVPRIMTIIPYWENGMDKFCSGDFFTEIFLSSCDRYGAENTRKLKNVSGENWIEATKSEILTFDPNYLIMDVEHDPVQSEWWSLDVFLTELRASGWEGKIVVIAFDSVWDSTRFHIDRITDHISNVIVVTIDRPHLRRNNDCVRYLGPVVLPMSLGTIRILRNLRHDPLQRNLNTTFVGSLYGYRRVFLESLNSQPDTTLVVNPQGKGVDYYNYLLELGKARSTINFSRSSGKNLRQFKCRIIESALLGCVVITDGENLISHHFPRIISLSFRNVKSLNRAIISGPELQKLSIEVNKPEYLMYIEDLVANSFWNQVVG